MSPAVRALALAGLSTALLLSGASTARVRSQIAPYLEVDQVVTADINGDGDVLTYTSAAAGIDAQVEAGDFEGQASYRYERRISYEDDIGDEDIHSGVAAGRLNIIPNTLSVEAGALAARTRIDGSGPIFGTTAIDDPNSTEVYGFYAGPSLKTQIGEVDVTAGYRLGYVSVDDDTLAGGSFRQGYDSGTTHDAAISFGMKPGELPFGWTIGAGYVREDVDFFDQSFEGQYVRGDIVQPVSPTLALTAGVGYEDIEATQQDILRDAGGLPVLTPGGAILPDPTRPPLLTYDESGIFWDVGVIYRPSRRTELQARVGERYGSFSATGSLTHQFNADYGVSVIVYDSIDSFGRLVISDLQDVPTSFDYRRTPLQNGFGGAGGCLFDQADAGTGVCFSDALQSTAGGNFRNRGVGILFSGGRGLWSFDLGAGYAHRDYRQPLLNGTVFSVEELTDQSFTLQASATRRLSRTSSIGVDAFASWYDSDELLADTSFGSGITGSYNRNVLLDRLEFRAAVGLYHTETGDFDSTFLSALAGLRYSF